MLLGQEPYLGSHRPRLNTLRTVAVQQKAIKNTIKGLANQPCRPAAYSSSAVTVTWSQCRARS